MSRVHIFVCLGLIFLGLVLGWLVSDISTGNVRAKTTPWEVPSAPENLGLIGTSLRETALKTGHFGVEPGQVVVAEPEPEETVIPFPVIVATANLDGVMVVSLKKADGSYVTAKAQDTLEGDWNILSVTMQQVIAEREGSEVEFNIYPQAAQDDN